MKTLNHYIELWKRETGVTNDDILKNRLSHDPLRSPELWIYFKWTEDNNVMPNQIEYYEKIEAVKDDGLREVLMVAHEAVSKICGVDQE